MPKAIDEKYLTVKAAKETHVFFISTNQEKIGKTTLLRQVMRSTEKIKYKNKRDRDVYHICINGRYCNDSFENDFVYKEKIQTIEICALDATGESISVESFENIKDANNALFLHIYQNDYLNDNRENRDCYFTDQEVEDKFDEFYAEKNNLNLDVSKSILRKKRMLKKIRVERETERIILKRERLDKESVEFIKLIDKNENETFGHTVIRLAEAIGYAIDKDVLFAAVRKIRGG